MRTWIGDVTRYDDARKVALASLEFGGRIDVLVNNPGIDNGGSVLDVDFAIWEKELTCKYFYYTC